MSALRIAQRLTAVAGLAVSMAGVVDELRPAPAFCGFEAGCESVTGSRFGRPLGIPLPYAGVAGFAVLLVLSLYPGKRTDGAFGVLSVAAGVAGAGLFAVQALVLRRYCTLCLAADACAMLLAMLQLLGGAAPSVGPPRWRWVWGVLAAAALALPWGLAWWRPTPPVPEAVRERWAAGKITLVMVTDFECEHCRDGHDTLQPFLEKEGDRVQLIVLVLPLPQNPHSRLAARAFWCAEQQGKGTAMAEALFAAEDLSAEGCERIARRVGLDLAKYQECLKSPGLDEAIDESTKWLDRHEFRGLPLLWVQDQLLRGDFSAAALENAYQRARRRHPDRVPAE